MPKHLWGKVLKKVTNEGIVKLIEKAIKKGTWKTLKNGSIEILYHYRGRIIKVTGIIVDGVLKVGDAWVLR